MAASSALLLGGKPAFAAPPDRFAALEAETGGRIGIAGVDTGTGAAILHRADERFPFCSTFKLLLAIGVLKRDTAFLGRIVAYGQSDLVSYSPVTSRHLKTGMSVAELCAAALQYSDNTAANLLIRQLGGLDAVTSVARSVGDSEFRLDRWETGLNTPGDARDTTTPAAMLADLRGAVLGDLLGAAQREQLADWMRGCTTGAKRIRAVAPAGAVVADKTGTGDHGTANDIAVIWPPGKPPIVLVVYITGLKKPTPDAAVAAAARIALDALTTR